MQAARVRRLFCVSASGLEPGPLWQRLIAKPILWAVLKEMYLDLVRMEAVVKNSTVDLDDSAPTEAYERPTHGALSGGD